LLGLRQVGGAVSRDARGADVRDALRSLAEAEADRVRLVELHERLLTAARAIGALLDSSGRHAADVASAAGSPPHRALPPDLVQAVTQMEQAWSSYSLQYLALKHAVDEESREFTTVSNVMKTKHDATKNSISNIR
jgi:hypothetical protein